MQQYFFGAHLPRASRVRSYSARAPALSRAVVSPEPREIRINTPIKMSTSIMLAICEIILYVHRKFERTNHARTGRIIHLLTCVRAVCVNVFGGWNVCVCMCICMHVAVCFRERCAFSNFAKLSILQSHINRSVHRATVQTQTQTSLLFDACLLSIHISMYKYMCI